MSLTQMGRHPRKRDRRKSGPSNRFTLFCTFLTDLTLKICIICGSRAKLSAVCPMIYMSHLKLRYECNFHLTF